VILARPGKWASQSSSHPGRRPPGAALQGAIASARRCSREGACPTTSAKSCSRALGHYLSIRSALRSALSPLCPSRASATRQRRPPRGQLALLSESTGSRRAHCPRHRACLARAHPDFQDVFVDCMNFPRAEARSHDQARENPAAIKRSRPTGRPTPSGAIFPTGQGPAGLANTLRFHERYGSDFLKVTPPRLCRKDWGCIETMSSAPTAPPLPAHAVNAPQTGRRSAPCHGVHRVGVPH